jgi:hypothetical protein
MLIKKRFYILHDAGKLLKEGGRFMRRFLYVLALFSIMTVLFACGGGGDSGGGGGTADTTAPVVTAFTMPTTATSLTVAVTTFTATDATAVTGYLITSSATAPTAGDAGWTTTAPTTYTFAAAGAQTAYAWAAQQQRSRGWSLIRRPRLTHHLPGQRSTPTYRRQAPQKLLMQPLLLPLQQIQTAATPYRGWSSERITSLSLS